MKRLAYDLKAAAEALSVSEDEINRWVRLGLLSPRWVGEKATKPLFLEAELLAAVESLPSEKGRTA